MFFYIWISINLDAKFEKILLKFDEIGRQRSWAESKGSLESTGAMPQPQPKAVVPAVGAVLTGASQCIDGED